MSIISKKDMKEFFFGDYMNSKTEEEFFYKLEQFLYANELEADLPVKPPLRYDEFVKFIGGIE